MKDQTEVCPLSREVMLPSDATSIHSITEWPSLSQSSSIRTDNSFPYGAPAQPGGDTDLPCSVRRTRWVRFCFSAGSSVVRVSPVYKGISSYCAFWLQPFSTFGCLMLTTFISSSLVLTIPSSLAPEPHWYLQPLLHCPDRFRPNSCPSSLDQ